MKRTQRGLSIVLLVTEAITLFGTALRISYLTLLNQVNHKPRLICNSSEDPDSATPSASSSKNKGKASKAMQSCACLSRLLQKYGTPGTPHPQRMPITKMSTPWTLTPP